MRFEVPAGNALVFTDQDGQPLSAPVLRPLTRHVEAGPDGPVA